MAAIDESTRHSRSSTAGYRAAILGTGFMGRVHAAAIRAAGGTVAGVVGSSPERAAQTADGIGAERIYPNAQAAFADDSVDVVHVCTPNQAHAQYTLDALSAGKHVVCEKPLATDVGTARAMAAAAESAGRTATVPFVYRFHPMAREARALVRDGEVGTLTVAHGGYLQDWLLRPDDDNWRVDPGRGGRTRAFADIGSHWCDLLEFITGDRITEVSAQLSTVHPERAGRSVSTEDIAVFQFRTATGVVGSSVISQVSPGRKNRLHIEVSGTRRSVHFDQERSERLWLGGRDRSSVLVRDPETLSPSAARYAVVPAGHPQGYQECFAAFVADTATAAAGTVPDGLPTFADGLRANLIAEAVLESAHRRRWVEVAP